MFVVLHGKRSKPSTQEKRTYNVDNKNAEHLK